MTQQVISFMYRDASNYKLHGTARVPIGPSDPIKKPLVVGDEITMTMLGFRIQTFFNYFDHQGIFNYDPEEDHEILTITELHPDDYPEDKINLDLTL